MSAPERIAAYLKRRREHRQTDYERIHGLDVGSNKACELLASDIETVIAAIAAARAEGVREGMLKAGVMDPASAFNRADWFWRAMDPDDCGDSPEEAINRAMVGRFCVCEIASSYAGPTRYGFIAPVLDPESDDEEFIHFATQQEAIEEAKRRAAAEDQP